MKSRNLKGYGAVMLAVAGCLWGGFGAQAQTMDQYYSVPPFVSDQVAPNIVLLLDNSGSMSGLGCDRNDDGDCVDVADIVFTNTTNFPGYFDSLTCYTYDTTDTRFEPAAVKATLATACATTQWDGNFINWATFRRFDALKKSMNGGNCFSTPRNADGTCPTYGSPALKTVIAQSSGVNTEMALVNYNAGAGANTYVGRMPSADYSGTPGTLYIGTDAAYFCIDNDNSFNANCGDGYSQRKYMLKVGSTTEPTGVIQQVGAQARFGLFEFKPAGDGARMLVGVGSRQSIDFSGGTVETFTTNSAAMVDAVDESFPSTWTPLSESLYETARYIAQINSTYLTTAYVYPIAYSGGISNGVAFQGTGVGSIGASEITALTGSETCPAGYITNACGRDPYFFGSNHTPPWATTSTQVTCCKTFVIIVTDGEPTQDTNIPAGLQDYAHGQHGQHCIGGNATIHAPNGTCNTNQATPAATLLGEHKTDYANSGNHYLDDVAFWAHTNDLRPCTGTADGTIAVLNVTGHCLSGFQNISVFTFFAFGNIAGREILMHTAKLGGFEDTNGNNLPDLTSEWDKVINATGAVGTDGIPDNYFESSNVDDLQDRLMAVVTAIIRKSASGTSVSVLSASATGEGSIYQAYFFTSDVGLGGASVKWTGYTQALFIDNFGNFREDTNQDGKLDYVTDLIIQTRFDNTPTSPTYKKTVVDKFVDANGDGVGDSTTPTVLGADLKLIKPIWEAGAALANTAPIDRRILTWVDSNWNGVVDAGEQMSFADTNCSSLKAFLRYPADSCSGTTSALDLIKFIRGEEVAGLRTRMIEVPVGSGTYKVWKLGDPIHSTPTVVSAPKSRYDLQYGDTSYNQFYAKYRNRREMVYLGANDGMLHAFNGGYYHAGDDTSTGSVVEHGWFTNSGTVPIGGEKWAFIPQQLLPHLQWLARPDYTHVYYVDLKPTVEDVRIFADDGPTGLHPGGWGTILIGGFRLGGSCGMCSVGSGAPPMTVSIGGQNRDFYSAYFVLDITDPEADPKLLWSFTDKDLGLTTAAPVVTRVSPAGDSLTSNANAKWYAIFASGPNSYAADLPPKVLPGPTTTYQFSYVYAVDLAAGPGPLSFPVSNPTTGNYVSPGMTKMLAGGNSSAVSKSFLGQPVAVDKDLDYRTDVVYVGRTRFNAALPWQGKLYRLKMSCPAAPCTPATWGINSSVAGVDRLLTEVIDNFPDPNTGSTLQVGPITAQPSWTVDDTNQLWVFFGTGRYFGNADKIDNSVQRVYGIKDPAMNNGSCLSGGNETSTTGCNATDLVNSTNAVVCVVCATGTNQVTDPTNNPGVTSFSGTGTTSMIGLVQSKQGWFINMPTGSGTNAAERSVVYTTLLGGSLFIPTFIPTSDFCGSDGSSNLYALYFKTGTAAASPVIGTATSGGNTNVTAKMSLGVGMASGLSVQNASAGAGGLGMATGTSGSAGGINLFSQMSNSNMTIIWGQTRGFYSYYSGWSNQRD